MTTDLIPIRIAAILAVVVASGGHAVSQGAPGHIRGTITDAQGGTFPVAFVEAKRQPSGPTVNGTGGAGEPYNIDVPAGTYDVSVSVPGMKSFRRTGLVVAAGATLRLDVRLEDTYRFGHSARIQPRSLRPTSIVPIRRRVRRLG